MIRNIAIHEKKKKKEKLKNRKYTGAMLCTWWINCLEANSNALSYSYLFPPQKQVQRDNTIRPKPMFAFHRTCNFLTFSIIPLQIGQLLLSSFIILHLKHFRLYMPQLILEPPPLSNWWLDPLISLNNICDRTRVNYWGYTENCWLPVGTSVTGDTMATGNKEAVSLVIVAYNAYFSVV